MTPRQAFSEALRTGPSDETRLAASKHPKWATNYALKIDEGPDPVTRAGACLNPRWAAEYAEQVDHGHHPDTLDAACKDAEAAYLYAKHVDRKSRPETRAAALTDPWQALGYAKFVDEWPHEDTRAASAVDPVAADIYARWAATVKLTPNKAVRLAMKNGGSDELRMAACGDPIEALNYARRVDEAPHPLTRAAALKQPFTAYCYAERLDCGPADDTRAAVCRKSRGKRVTEEGALYARLYAERIDKKPHPLTREAAMRVPHSGADYTEWEERPERERLAKLKRERDMAECERVQDRVASEASALWEATRAAYALGGLQAVADLFNVRDPFEWIGVDSLESGLGRLVNQPKDVASLIGWVPDDAVPEPYDHACVGYGDILGEIPKRQRREGAILYCPLGAVLNEGAVEVCHDVGSGTVLLDFGCTDDASTDEGGPVWVVRVVADVIREAVAAANEKDEVRRSFGIQRF